MKGTRIENLARWVECILKPFTRKGLCQICNSGDVESEEHFMSKCSKYKSIRDELHIRVNNWLKNAIPEQRVIEEHILKSSNSYVQKALAKYISDAFNLRENHMGNKNIPKK